MREDFPADIASLVGMCWYAVWGAWDRGDGWQEAETMAYERPRSSGGQDTLGDHSDLVCLKNWL
jgi:hypothetical protein